MSFYFKFLSLLPFQTSLSVPDSISRNWVPFICRENSRLSKSPLAVFAVKKTVKLDRSIGQINFSIFQKVAGCESSLKKINQIWWFDYMLDPSKHTTSFWRPYNVHNAKTTSCAYWGIFRYNAGPNHCFFSFVTFDKGKLFNHKYHEFRKL